MPEGEGWEESSGVWDGHVLTDMFKMNNEQRPAAHELCSVLRGSLDGRGVWGRMDACIRTSESLCCPPETTTTVSISYTPIQNTQFNNKVYVPE